MFTAIIKKRGKQFEALCTELNVTSKGLTIENALDNLKDVVNSNLQDKSSDDYINSKEVFIIHFEISINNT